MNDRHPPYIPLGLLCFAHIVSVFIIIQASSNISPVTLVYAEPPASRKAQAPALTKNEQSISDDRITFAVENALHLDSGVSSRLIDIDTKSGIVVLDGSVSNLLSKQRAILRAETIKGVRSVIDQLIVMPSGMFPDQQIQQDVFEALTKNLAVDSSLLPLSVTDGVVTIEGQVDSWPSRELVMNTIKGVKGVRKVVNHMTVKETDHRSDSEIQAEIQQRVHSDVWLSEWLIGVDVKDGNVTLSGMVSSAAEKTRAHKMAWTAGVKDTDGSGLKVEWWARQGFRRANPLAIREEKDIAQTILEAWSVAPRIEVADPKITIKNGTAILRGSVSALQGKLAAAQDAKNTIGVFRVRNFLKVRPIEPRTDQEVADDIRAAIVRDPFLQRLGLSVSVFDGVAYLAGAVDNTFQKTHAQNIASQMPGVVEVLNRLRAPTVLYDKNDPEISQDIHDELWWSPFLNSEKINVRVEDGVATLTGTVNSWREKQIAAENAREGGAMAVRNKLIVREP